MKNSRFVAALVLFAAGALLSQASEAEVSLAKDLVVAQPVISPQKITCYKSTTTKKGSSLIMDNSGPVSGSGLMTGKTAVEYTVFGTYKFLVDDNGSVADYKTIGEALSASSNRDTIYVCPGTYREMITISKNVKLIGIAGADETTIDSSTLGDGTVVGMQASATLQGFTITGAHHDVQCFYGGGIKISGTTTAAEGTIEIKKPIIQQNIITGNDACQGGDGIQVDGGSRSGYGEVHNQAVIRNNIIAGNSGGIGILLDCSQANGTTIQNNVIADQSTGIYVDDNDSCDATSQIVNNAIYDTSGPFITYVVEHSTATPSYVFNATLEYNDYYQYTSATFDASALSVTNMNVDPMFTDTTHYRLDAASPLVNAGDPDSTYNDTDGSRNDIGAYGDGTGKW